MAITLGNRKLGRSLIYTFSLPLGKQATCKGASPECIKWCYGGDGHFVRDSVSKSLKENLEASKSEHFVSWMVLELRRRSARVVRPHVVGDFYNSDYVEKWANIMRTLKSVQFFCYTRSHAVNETEQALRDLARQTNLQMWWSIDRSMEVPKRIPSRVQLAYMQVAADDLPPPGVNLVFRVKPLRKTVVKAVNGVLVCPEEQRDKSPVTCEKCGVCWHDPRKHPTKRARNRVVLAA